MSASPSQPTEPSAPSADAQGGLDRDVSCRACGYNLRTLLLSALCPECGAPVIDSLPANVLGECDADWLSSVGRGIERIRDALLIYMMMPFIIVGFGVVRLIHPHVEILAAALLGTPIGLKLTGVWRIARPEPSRRLRHLLGREAFHIRIAHIVDAWLVALVVMLDIGQPDSPLPTVALIFYFCFRFHMTWATARFARALMQTTGAAIRPRLLTALTCGHYLLNAAMLAVALCVSLPALAARLQMTIAYSAFWVTLPPMLTALVVVIVVLMIGLAAVTMPVLQRIQMVIVAAEGRARRIRAGCNSAVAERIASQIETLD